MEAVTFFHLNRFNCTTAVELQCSTVGTTTYFAENESHRGRKFLSKRTLKKTLSPPLPPELKPSITVFPKESFRWLLLYVLLICKDRQRTKTRRYSSLTTGGK